MWLWCSSALVWLRCSGVAPVLQCSSVALVLQCGAVTVRTHTIETSVDSHCVRCGAVVPAPVTVRHHRKNPISQFLPDGGALCVKLRDEDQPNRKQLYHHPVSFTIKSFCAPPSMTNKSDLIIINTENQKMANKTKVHTRARRSWQTRPMFTQVCLNPGVMIKKVFRPSVRGFGVQYSVGVLAS